MRFECIFYYRDKRGNYKKSKCKERFFVIDREHVASGEYRELFQEAFNNLGMKYECYDYKQSLTVKIPAYYTDEHIESIDKIPFIGNRKDFTLAALRKKAEGVYRYEECRRANGNE